MLREAAETVAYDNPNEEWGAKWLQKIETYVKTTSRVVDPVIKTLLNREEIEFVKNVFNGKQMDIAQP